MTLSSQENPTRSTILPYIEALFSKKGKVNYGEGVSQEQHALQAAVLADQNGDPPTLIAAALLHDIAHLFPEEGVYHAALGIDAEHEKIGAEFLDRFFVSACVDPVRMHVDAKRYLCTAEPGYRAQLSTASELSLTLQGGPMTSAEVEAFESNAYFEDALKLRRYDEAAKVVGLRTPPLKSFRDAITASLK